MDDIAKKIISRVIGCHMSFICTGIFLYANDLFFIAPSVHTLKIMLNICETELYMLDIRINVNKSVCMRFEQRFSIQSANLITDSRDELKWVEKCRYLDAYLIVHDDLNAIGIMQSARFIVHIMLYLAG